LKIALSIENNQKIMLFSTDKAIFKAPYKITFNIGFNSGRVIVWASSTALIGESTTRFSAG
jgi:hypothetical protein